MNDIRSLIRLAGRRLELGSFLGSLHITAIVFAALAVLLAIADRLPSEPFVPWVWVVPLLAAACVIVAAALWSRRRLTDLQIAVAVDDRLQLRERLSTALHCHEREDAFAQAAVEDAVATARDPRSWETARRRFDVQAPPRWWISPLLLIAVTGVLFMGQADLFAEEQNADDVRRARLETDEALEAIIKTVESKPELRNELAGLVDELSEQQRHAEQFERPDDVKRSALKKVTELNRRIDDILSGQKGKTERALRDMLAGLQPPDEGAGRELAEALAKGDFQGAKQALEKMMSELQDGSMSEAQKEQLAQQVENIAKQLDQLAQTQQALEEALQRAGLNPQLANNPQALQQALQQAQNLNDQQRQQLQQMIQAQQAAQQMCQGLGGACQQMAQAMQGKGGQGQGQGGQQMLNQLDAMEQLQMLMQQAQAAANQAGGGLGQGMNLNQALDQWGGGMGRRGQGSGGRAPITRTPSGTVLTKADVPTVDGEIIASMLIDGVPIRGESKAKLKEVMATSATGFDEALGENPLPRRYHEVQKHYFGELQKQVEAMPITDEGATEGGAAEEGSSAGNAESGG